MRALLIVTVVAVLLGGSGTAEARRGGIVVINTGDDIEHIRDLPDDLAKTIGYGKLGYRYERFGVFWLDLWRWDGEFVVYSGDTYVPLDGEALDVLGGASVPWRYHLPEGLLLAVAGIYFAAIGRRRRRVKTTLYLAGGFAALAIAFFFMGLTWEFGIPLVIAVHHGLSARAATQARDDDAPAPADDEPAPVRTSRPLATPPTSGPGGTPAPIADRPSQPLVVERPSTAPAAVPMRADDNADGPKLLR